MKIVLSCEHASVAVPRAYQYLFKGEKRDILWSHRGWDPGAYALARALGEQLNVPVLKGEWTRLLLDLNRSRENPARWSEFSMSLSDVDRNTLDAKIFDPYWKQLTESVAAEIRISGKVVHLSIHSFVRVLNGTQRDLDIGVLFDPDRVFESSLSTQLISGLRSLQADPLRVRENLPYAGTDDGLTRLLRMKFEDSAYAGIEIEVCSDLLEENNNIEEIAKLLHEAISGMIAN